MPTGGSSGGASSGAVRAGGAYVEAFLKDNKLVRGLEGVKRRLKAFGSFMIGIGKSATVAGGLIAAPLLAAVNHFTKVGDIAQKTAIRTGLSTEAISELGYAAEQSGANLEMLSNGLKFMSRFTDAVKDGSTEATKRLDEFGISTEEFLAATPEQRFEMLADGIAGIKDESLRAAAAMDIFGRSGDMLVPLLEGGAKGVRDLRMEAKQLGLSISRKEADEAAAFGDAWNRVKRATMGGVFALGSSLVPGLMLVVNLMKEGAVGVSNFLRENKILGLIIGGVAAGLFLAGGAAIAFGVAMKGVALIVGTATLAFKALGIVIGILSSPIFAVVAAITAIGAVFLTQTEAGQKFVGAMGDGFNSIKTTALEAWEGIVGAVQKGDLQLAAAIAFKGIELEWEKMTGNLSRHWHEFKADFLNVLDKIRTEIAKGLTDSPGLWDFFADVEDAIGWAERQLGMSVGPNKSRTAAEELRRDPNAVRNQLDAMQREGAKQRSDALAASIAEQEATIRRLQMEFDDLVNRGRTPANRANAPGMAESDSLHRMKQLAEGLGEASKGLFQSPNFKQALGIGDKIQQKQLDEQKKAAKHLGNIDRKLDDAQPMRIR